MLFAIFSLLALGKKNEEALLHDRLIRVNEALLDAFAELTQTDPPADTETDEVDRTVLGVAEHCMHLDEIPVDFDDVERDHPCLKDYCNAIEDEAECMLDENYQHGCSWCGNQCSPYFAYQKAFTTCVRDAYKDSDPDKVNDKPVPMKPSEAAFDTTFFNHPIGKPAQSGLPYVGKMRWAFNTASRDKGYRVPIHVHPFAGMSCITTHSGFDETVVTAEGEPDLILASGKCYTMPPLTKLGPYNYGGYTVLDTFVWNACYPIWVIIEPGSEEIQDKQFIFTSDLDGTLMCDSEEYIGERKAKHVHKGN